MEVTECLKYANSLEAVELCTRYLAVEAGIHFKLFSLRCSPHS